MRRSAFIQGLENRSTNCEVFSVALVQEETMGLIP